MLINTHCIGSKVLETVLEIGSGPRKRFIWRQGHLATGTVVKTLDGSFSIKGFFI